MRLIRLSARPVLPAQPRRPGLPRRGCPAEPAALAGPAGPSWFQLTTGVGYANMMGEGRPVYPQWTHARLRSVKTEWDPANVFRSNHNISPFA